MRLKNLIFAMAIALMANLALPSAFAADKEPERVLHKLDAAARNFHTTAADFQFDSYETDPIPDKDTQRGRIYYQRNGSAIQMAVHVAEHNGKPDGKVYTYVNGVFRLFEPKMNQITVLTKFNKFESYVLLGFGASGEDLEKKWEVKAVGAETLDGIHCDKLELTARDPEVRKHLGKVTLWVDADRAISVKQVFEESASAYRVSVYFNVKMNQPLPGDAFVLKTNAQTQTVVK